MSWNRQPVTRNYNGVWRCLSWTTQAPASASLPAAFGASCGPGATSTGGSGNPLTAGMACSSRVQQDPRKSSNFTLESGTRVKNLGVR